MLFLKGIKAMKHLEFPISISCQNGRRIVDKTGREIAECNDYDFIDREREANAAFIVKAVNCHDELVEALENLQKQLKEHVKFDVKKHYSLMVVDALATKTLKKAKGESK